MLKYRIFKILNELVESLMELIMKHESQFSSQKAQ